MARALAQLGADMSVMLVTGADGHIGAAVIRWLLANTKRRLLLGVRAHDDDEWTRKLRRLPADARCSAMRIDLRDQDPFAGVDPGQVEEILHCAAIIDFTLPKTDAAAVNVDGTRRVVELARRCPRLRRCGLVSSLYSAGLATGVVREALLSSKPEFANYYEWSKWEAEQILAGEPGLPWQVFRLSTVLAQDGHGRVGQQNVIHNTLRLLFYGLLPVLPGNPATRVYTVTTDYAAAGIGALLTGGEARRVFHLTDAGATAPTLGEVADAAYRAFRADDEFRRARILKPRFCDYDTYGQLADTAQHFGTAMAQSFGSVAPFVPQLYADKSVLTKETVRALAGRTPPRGGKLVAAVARELASTRWGLRESNAGRISR